MDFFKLNDSTSEPTVVLLSVCVALPYHNVNICTNRGEDGAVVGAAGQVGQGLETGAVTACHTGLNKRKVFNRKKKR